MVDVAVEVTLWTFTASPGPERERTVAAILASELAVAPAEVRLDRRCRHCGHPSHGKPVVAGAPGFSFNVSHSGPLVVVAVAHEAEVGVDIEALRPRRYLERLATRVLTPAEHTQWATLPEDRRLAAFLRHWTEREAYLKAIGLGLTGSLRDALAGAQDWTIVAIDGLTGAVGSVAVDAPARVSHRFWPPVR